jgi:hypothetical protein
MFGMDAEKTALLFGPYRAPRLKVGSRVSCRFRDAEVVVYGFSAAPIPWPLCYRAGTRAFGKGLLVEERLARAIQQESVAALCHWWGVSRATVRKWRAAFGIGRMDTEGSRRLIHRAALGALNARRKLCWSEVRLWTREELALVGTFSDAEVGRLVGRTAHAVAAMRHKLNLPPHDGAR